MAKRKHYEADELRCIDDWMRFTERWAIHLRRARTLAGMSRAIRRFAEATHYTLLRNDVAYQFRLPKERILRPGE